MGKRTYNILQLNEVDSTQNFSIKNIDEFSHGQIVLAERQTGGRGRMNRKWVSENENNLYMSLILKPVSTEVDKLPLASLTQLMSLAICNSILNLSHEKKQPGKQNTFVEKEYSVKPVIKWPNDVLIYGKKVSGILSQAVFNNNEFKGIVMGVGLNISLKETESMQIDQPATSLNKELDVHINKNHIMNSILDYFFDLYPGFMKSGFSIIKNNYLSFFPFIGREIKITGSDHRVVGRIKNISNAGSLILEDSSGKNINITMGEMQCL